jgi:hypothetical protein
MSGLVYHFKNCFIFTFCLFVLFLKIIHVNLTQDSPKPLEAGKKLDLMYSVKWIPTTITFARRFDVYLDYPFFEHQVGFYHVLIYILLLNNSSNSITFSGSFIELYVHLTICRSIGSQFSIHL